MVGSRSSRAVPPTRDIGARAERAVAAPHLEAAGLEILALNLRIGRLEASTSSPGTGPSSSWVEVRARGPGA